jgi:hypothetical protein
MEYVWTRLILGGWEDRRGEGGGGGGIEGERDITPTKDCFDHVDHHAGDVRQSRRWMSGLYFYTREFAGAR